VFINIDFTLKNVTKNGVFSASVGATL